MLEPAYDVLLVSGRIACKAAAEEKPYHQLEKCAQNGGNQLGVSFGFFPCEYCPVKCEEFDLSFIEPCQLTELVNYCGGMEGALAVPDHKFIHMDYF